MKKKKGLTEGLMLFYMMVMKMALLLFVGHIALSFVAGFSWRSIQGVKTRDVPARFEENRDTYFNIGFNPPKGIDSTNIAENFYALIAVYEDTNAIYKDSTDDISVFKRTYKGNDVSWEIGDFSYYSVTNEAVVPIRTTFRKRGIRYIQIYIAPLDTTESVNAKFAYMTEYITPGMRVEIIPDEERLFVKQEVIQNHPIELMERVVITAIENLENLNNIVRIRKIDRDSFATIDRGKLYFHQPGIYRVGFSLTGIIITSSHRARTIRGFFLVKPNLPPFFAGKKTIHIIKYNDLDNEKIYPRRRVPLVHEIIDYEGDNFVITAKKLNRRFRLSNPEQARKESTGELYYERFFYCPSGLVGKIADQFITVKDAWGHEQDLIIRIIK